MDYPLFVSSCFLNRPLILRMRGIGDSVVTSLLDSNLEGLGKGGRLYREACPGLSRPLGTGGQDEIIPASAYGRSQNINPYKPIVLLHFD